jgi:diguanylate cyclase (GGDEF)-like protein
VSVPRGTHPDPLRARCERALAEAVTERARVRHTAELIELLADRDALRARALAGPTLEAAERLDDPWLVARTRLAVAYARIALGRTERVGAEMRAAREMFTDLGDAAMVRRARLLMATVTVYRGDAAAATAMLHELMPELASAGDEWLHARAVNELGNAHAIRAEVGRALDLYADAERRFRGLGDRAWTAIVLQNAAFNECVRAERAIEEGRPEDAARDFASAAARCGAARADVPDDAPLVTAYVEGAAGRALHGLGRLDDALAAFARAETAGTRAGDTRVLGENRAFAARTLAAAGRGPAAVATIESAIATLERADDGRALAGALLVASEVHEAGGRYREALTAHRRFHAVRERLHRETMAATATLHQLRAEADRAREEARLDPLTGLPNRRALEDRVLTLTAEATRTGMPLALGLLDLDHFKRINDEHSHLTGDEVLRVCARLLRAACREDDVVARLGGEEFALLLPEADIETATAVCERVRQRIAHHDWSSVAEGVVVTASVGVVEVPAEGPDAAFARADANLYMAKAAGRDRVVAGSD